MAEEKSPDKEEAGKLMNGGPPGESTHVPQYAATIVVDILHLIYGLGIAWPAIALPVLMGTDRKNINTTVDATYNASVINVTSIIIASNITLNDTINSTSAGSEEPFTITLEQGSWLAAVLYISAIPSMPIFSYASEKYGRKVCGYLIGVPYIASAVLLSLSSSFAGILASRALFGLASGGIFIFAPLYVSEIVEDDVRARMGAFVTLMRNIGILFTYVLGSYLSYKQFEYIAIIPPVLFIVIFYWMPESPMHLLRQKKVDEAEKALRWLRGDRADVPNELNKMQESLAAMKSEGARSATLCDLVATHGSRRAVITGFLMSINQQWCGFYGITSYTFIIFGEASPSLQKLSNVILGTMLVIGIGGAMMLYDKLRRKVLLHASNFLMIVSLFVLSIYFYLKDHGSDVSQFTWLPVTATSIYILGYTGGAATLPIVILTEIFSPKIRNLGLTTNGAFTWFIIFLVAKTFPEMTETIGFHGACWVYIACCILGVVVTVKILPETRNRSLESILDELEYGKNNRTRKSKRQDKTKVEESLSLTDKDKTEKEKHDECAL